MKKFIIAFLVVFSVGAFASEVKLQTLGSWGFDLKSKDSQQFALGKTYSVASYKTGDSTLTGIIRWEKMEANKGGSQVLDYLYLDTPIELGTLRIGIQRLGLGNYGMGVPQTTPFLTATCLKAPGVSLSTPVMGLPTKVFLAQNVFLLDEAKTGENNGALGVLVDTKMGSSVGVIYQKSISEDVGGVSLYADYVASLMGVNFQLQAFYDLSDDAQTAAVNNFSSFTKARKLVNLAVDTKVAGLGTVYGFFLSNLNVDNNATLISQYAVGVEYMLSKEVNLVVEFGELDNTTNGKTQTLKAAFEFMI